MSAPLLSHEELAALREGIQQTGLAAVEDVELAGVDRVLRKHAPLLDRRLHSFADAAQGVFSRALRAGCRLVNRPFELVGPRAAQEQLAQLLVCAAVTNESKEKLGVIGLDATLTYAVIERAFGAALAKPEEDQTWMALREGITEIERRTVSPWIEELVRCLAQTVAQSPGQTPKLASTIDEAARDVPGDLETMLAWHAGVDYGVARGELALMLFPVATEVLTGRSIAGKAKQPEWLTQHVARMEIDVSAELGKLKLSLGELIALEPGDVIKLDRRQADSIPVRVGRVPRFTGRPSQRNGAYAVEIDAEIAR